jgi:hypothetical protein
MNEIVRLYFYTDGKETCVKDPHEMVRLLSDPQEEIDLDYHDARGHAKAATSKDLIGQTVKIGEEEVQIPEH